MQISNATTVHVRRPGNPKKWRARILCEGIICDLALLTVDEDEFWSGDLMSLQFVDVPELQVAYLLLAEKNTQMLQRLQRPATANCRICDITCSQHFSSNDADGEGR